jgi:hypothetical protein
MSFTKQNRNQVSFQVTISFIVVSTNHIRSLNNEYKILTGKINLIKVLPDQ